MTELYFCDGISKTQQNCSQWDLNPCRHLFMQVKQDNSSGRDETKIVSSFTFPPQALLFWSPSVWMWLAMRKPEAMGIWPRYTWQAWQQLSAVKQQGEQFSFMDWSINGAFLPCPDVDFHKVCGGWYLWNISSAELVRISLWVWSYLDGILQTEILFASFL